MRPKKNKNNSFRFVVFSFILFLGCVGAGFLIWQEKSTSSPMDIKIGLLEGDKIWSQLPAIRHLKDALNKSLNAQQKKFSRLEAELRKENQELVQEQQTLASQAKHLRTNLEQRQKAFSLKVMQLQKDAEETQKKINHLYEEAMTIIKEKINQSIKKIARKKNLSLVLYDNQVAYRHAALNITDDVFNDLKDFQYPSLKW